MKKLLTIIVALTALITLSTDSITAFNNGLDGFDSYGTMIDSSISDGVFARQENNGCNVFSVEITGQTATVELQTTRDSTVVVGVYDKTGAKLIMTAMAAVNAGDERAVVTFAEPLPQDFHTRSYLIDSESMRPLCRVYENGNCNQIAQISLGYYQSAAITTDGRLYTWGRNDEGQLGNGEGGSYGDCSSVPKKIMDDAVSVSFGYFHGAAITADGSLYMWGGNSSGQRGDGELIDDNTTLYDPNYIPNPEKVLEDVDSVSLGAYHSSAIKKDRRLYLWGDCNEGKIGFGSRFMTKCPLPWKIMDDTASVSLGVSHSAAITTDGILYLWGSGWYGELGHNISGSTVPKKLMENVSSVSLSGGNYMGYSAAITTDGDLYMWGDNLHGQLGRGYSGVFRYDPVKIMENVVSVSLGGSHSAAITADGSLYMWGDNFYGQLGNGEGGSYGDHSSAPVKIMDNVASVSLGTDHSAALTTDGSLYMWGHNRYGELGNGTTTDSHVPIKIEIPAEISETVSGLLPNEVYNVYGMKNLLTSEPFSPDNLLYIAQYTTDASGTLGYDYQPSEDFPNPVIFFKAMREFDVKSAQIIDSYVGTDSITLKWEPFNGADMYRIYRVENGCFIEEGTTSVTEYTVENLESGMEYGFVVTCRVNGEWSCESADDAVYIMTDAFTFGDLNGDGNVNITDAIELLKYVAKLDNNVVNTAGVDIDGNGTVNINDAIALLKQIAGLA